MNAKRFKHNYNKMTTSTVEKVVLSSIDTVIVYMPNDKATVKALNLVGLDSDRWQVSITADIHKLYLKDK